MAHDVFISYSAADKPIADAVCSHLEQKGVRCWIAPRDVLPGEIWGSAIVEAIHKSPVMVVVFSSSSNKSPQVMREVERAVNKGLVVVPFRIEPITPSENMEYFLSSTHWCRKKKWNSIHSRPSLPRSRIGGPPGFQSFAVASVRGGREVLSGSWASALDPGASSRVARASTAKTD